MAACGKVRAKGGETPAGAGSGEIGEFAREFIAIKTAILWVDFEAGERVGAVYGPRLGLQRTATPPAFIMFVFCKVSPLSKYGAVFGALMPYTVP